LLWTSLQQYYSQIKEQDCIPDLGVENQNYLELLQCLLSRTDTHTKCFQKEELSFDLILPKLKETFCLTAELLVRPELIDYSSKEKQFSSVYNLPYHNNTQIKTSLKSSDLFEKDFLTKFPQFNFIKQTSNADHVSDLVKTATRFLIQFLKGIKERIPLQDEILQSTQILKLPPRTNTDHEDTRNH